MVQPVFQSWMGFLLISTGRLGASKSITFSPYAELPENETVYGTGYSETLARSGTKQKYLEGMNSV
jgi:hypothetical protein